MEDMWKHYCIQGYHVYSTVWEAAIWEEVTCEKKPNNVWHHYALAVRRNEVITGHFLVCWSNPFRWHTCTTAGKDTSAPGDITFVEEVQNWQLCKTAAPQAHQDLHVHVHVLQYQKYCVLIIHSWNIFCWKYFRSLILLSSANPRKCKFLREWFEVSFQLWIWK